MANKLKIYACSGVGQAEEQENSMFDYWLDDVNPLYNTQAVNALNIRINLLVSKLKTLNLSREEKISKLNDLDLFAVCMYYAQLYSGNKRALEEAGWAIGKVLSDGEFSYDSTNNTDRDSHLDVLISHISDLINEGVQESSNEGFNTWWNENVLDLDKEGFTQRQKEIISEYSSGISGNQDFLTNNASINEKLQNAGTYFMYLFFTDAQLAKMPRTFTSKKKAQLSTFNYCKTLYAKEVGTKNAESAMMDLIRANIIIEYGSDPETICADIAAGGKRYDINGIGAAEWIVGTITIKEFIGIVIDVLKFLLTLILQLVQMASAVDSNVNNDRQKKTAQDGVPSQVELNRQLDNTPQNPISSISPIALIGIGALILFSIRD